MKLRYHQATISFCPDLLDPEGAAPVPVGVLVLAQTTDLAVALLTVDSNPRLPDSLPPVVREIARDFPALVRGQLEQILHSDAGASIDTILEVFEDSLRNSFFVSEIKLNQELEVHPPGPAQTVDVGWLYGPTTSLASATVATAFSKPSWVDTASHYRPWLLRPRYRAEAHVGR